MWLYNDFECVVKGRRLRHVNRFCEGDYKKTAVKHVHR